MAKSKKWQIEKLRKNQNVASAAKLIVGARLTHLFETIEKYFNEMNAENLHDIRISLRRVRYNMELFISCFNRKQFMNIYNIIQNLQDLSGSVRDLDVFKENINLLVKDEKVKVNKVILIKVEERRNGLEDRLKLSLMKFKHSKAVKNFYKIV
ncbi:MAG TPA: CHAD domain-containing protein [Ignavibacteriaceae bacterium]|nr:CHAD domain-containing protein [Ignavibacteriaceae bacterium]